MADSLLLDLETKAGLCATCENARRIESARGSVFILCELSFSDGTFAKYPRLPVFSCGGYKKRDGAAAEPVSREDE
jgi:hypothetical protein